MSQIKRNSINDSESDEIILQYLADFKAKKCLFCFQSEPKFLCQCKECNYYFCNNFHRKTTHIILHLRNCSHKKISLSPFDMELKCKNCNMKDIFNLYFNEDIILCKECINEDDLDEYTKIIENKQINNKILPCPDVPPLANRLDSYSESLITIINNKINFLKSHDLPSVSLNYTKKKRYIQIYNTLIESEKYDIEEENSEEDSYLFELKFDIIDNFYVVAEIKKENQDFQFYPRQLLIVSKAENENKSFLARVIEIDKSQKKITIFFKDLEKVIKNGYYNIKEKESVSSYERVIDNLQKLKKEHYSLLDKNILSLIIGKQIKDGKEEISNENKLIDYSKLPLRLDISNMENIKLNQSQKNAFYNCYKNKLTLIKGPPGTGKTTVLAYLTYHIDKILKTTFTSKILLCAPSNRAVDNISSLLQKLNLNFVRVLSNEKEMTEEVDKTNSLNDLIQIEIDKEIEKNPKNKKFKDLIERKNKYGFLKGEDFTNYNNIISEFQDKILNPCHIILSTINNSADPRISNFEFPVVIIDEATQALEPDCLLPLCHKAQMVVMIGDEKQLGPTVISKNTEISGLGMSLFERLSFYYNGSSFISTLNEQYRMHKFLYEFSNKHFYNNQMITLGDIKLDENVQKNFIWPRKDKPSFFYNVTETEKEENYSYYNEKEINVIFGIVHRLFKAGVDMKDIGIITPYNAQKYRLYDKFEDERYDNLKIESVDGFQGMEKDYIIISTVRSNVSGKIGFLNLTKRFNVAATRGRKGVIYLGNAECLAKKNGIWRDFIKFYFDEGLIVQGNLNNLELVPKEEIFINDINSDDENEKEIMKKEKHSNIKKDLASSYLKSYDAAPLADKSNKSNKKIKIENDGWNIEEEKEEEEKEEKEEKESNIFNFKNKKKKKKNKKSKNESSSSDEDKKENEIKNKEDKKSNKSSEEEEDEKENDGIKNKKNKKNKSSDEEDEKDEKKGRKKNNNKKEKEQKNKKDDEKNDNKNKKKGNKKDSSSSDEENNNKNKKKGKNKEKK